tara:strand:- start:9762 stop:10916 length:1155 start_codon:yes stop_codon:yes gene_type:complete
MAVYKLFPIKDSTIYSGYPVMNTGLDELLEVNSEFPITLTPSPRVARSLIQFDQTEIDKVFDTKILNSNWSSSLQTFISVAEGVTQTSTIYCYPLTGSWVNGTGQYLDSPQTMNGVSWDFTQNSGSGVWDVDTTRTFVTSSYPDITQRGGGTWYTGSDNPNIISVEKSQSFSQRSTKDLNINITDQISLWYSSSKNLDSGYVSVKNEGLILKWSDNLEFTANRSVQPIMKFYSVDTNTIYPPTLNLKWVDVSYNTTLTEISTTDLFIGLDSNPGVFRADSINRFRLNVRPEFPVRTFQTASIYTTNFALPQDSYYAIKDLDTNEFVIDFDTDFTKISCDNNSNYFDIYMNGLQPERYYKVLIKTTISSSVIVKDEDYYFKVING